MKYNYVDVVCGATFFYKTALYGIVMAAGTLSHCTQDLQSNAASSPSVDSWMFKSQMGHFWPFSLLYLIEVARQQDYIIMLCSKTVYKVHNICT